MIKISFHLLPIFLVVALFSSCRKLADQILKDNGSDLRICNIKSITFPDEDGEMRELIFLYNSDGNPVQIKNSKGATPYPHNFYFRYDKKNQLTDVIGIYDGNNVVESWTKYYYDGSGNVIKDSTWTWGMFGQVPDPNSHSISVSNYTLDSKKRVILVSGKYIYPDGSDDETFSNKYIYDKKGNRKGGTYDNGINIFRTNKIWQLIALDYSNNNAISASEYNEWNLPVRIQGGNLEFLNFNLAENSTITYFCP